MLLLLLHRADDLGKLRGLILVQPERSRKQRQAVGRDELELWKSTLIQVLTLLTLPLCSHFLSTKKKREQRVKRVALCKMLQSLKHVQRKYEIPQLQRAI